ncbi:MAG: excinuclease ABC subunit UvrA [Parvularculales bacterium]
MKHSSGRSIHITGAREHNLRNISLTLPRDQLVVVTGLSGSGKSSLAFDTIYAEGQRRYVESLSAYARQFLQMMQKPDVDQIDGLSPAISIEQKTTSRNPRSTVGTVTEIYDYMRLLFARIGVPYSPTTGLPIASQSVTEMVDRLKDLPDGTRFYLLAPIIRGRKGEYRKEIAELLKRGFQRIKIDGEFYELEDSPALDKKFKHDLEVVVDRLVMRESMGNRLADSLETTLQLADGLAIAEMADSSFSSGGTERLIFSSRFACPVSGFTIEEIEPRLFSFNNPFGACPSCDGLGTQFLIDPDLVISDNKQPLNEGAIVPWSRGTSPYYRQTLESVAVHYGVKPDMPWGKVPSKVKKIVLYGSNGESLRFSYDNGRRSYTRRRAFEGVIPSLERRYREACANDKGSRVASWTREEIEKYQSVRDCETCQGFRLKPEALAVKLNDLHIGDVSRMSIQEANQWFTRLPQHLDTRQNRIAGRILKEIQERLKFLNDVGLDYLTLSRNSGTLSGGESQRIRLASQIGSGLTGVLYVLDEPSIGLHQRDNARLLKTLQRLRNLGNTVIVVEHDEDAIREADHVVDIGPGAGIHGGKIVAEGAPDAICKSKQSLTGQYLTGKLAIPVPEVRRGFDKKSTLKLAGATGNNLKSVTATIPLGVFTCVTGVSGSGKSTLLIDTLYRALSRLLMGTRENPAPYGRIDGLKHLDKIIDIDQSPIGRTPRSNPATYTGAFTPIRDWFANLPESRGRGYKPGRFSFNVKGGRCENCQGGGMIKIEMHFLPDIYVECDVCGGKRYNRETLEIKYKDKSIADVLDMTVEEAAIFFKFAPAIREKMETLRRVGLDYIKVGQQATTLSGGEAQRVKLARELSRRATGRTLYLLDEPTTGLHFHDVAKLLQVLHELVDAGNTVIVIEHNLEVIKTADWIIDLGPEGGDGGGEIVATGTPEAIAAAHKTSHTGVFLKRSLPKRLTTKKTAKRSTTKKPAKKTVKKAAIKTSKKVAKK